MRNYEILNQAVLKLGRFIKLDHEGLSADEHAHLKNHLKRIIAVANELEDDYLKTNVDHMINKDIQSKINNLMERSNDGKA